MAMYLNRTTEEHIFKLVDESISENTFAELNPWKIWLVIPEKVNCER